jgi:5'-nucleotidase
MTLLRGWALALPLAALVVGCGNVTSEPVDATPTADATPVDGEDLDPADAGIDATDPDIVGEVATPLLPLLSPSVPEQASGETSMGLVVADSQLAATAGSDRGGAVIAFMNPGGVRAGLDVGPVTVLEVGRVQPFMNGLTTMTLTGAQIEQLLEQQFAPTRRILQPSAGFTYTLKTSVTSDYVDPATIRLNGVTLLPTATYRVTVNDFLATGGDMFSVLASGTDRVSGVPATDALVAYLRANSPISAPTPGRITATP